MDIVEFFQLSSGKWFSIRTSHHLALNQSESGKSDLKSDLLDPTHTSVVDLCQQQAIAPEHVLLALETEWTGGLDSDTKKTTGSSLLVLVATDAANPNVGQLFQSRSLITRFGTTQSPTTTAHYSLGADDVLTITTTADDAYVDERIWFASPNLRFRSSKLKRTDGFQTAAFYSEIRMGLKAAPEASPATAE
jgi:hypothetical protein